MQTKSSYRVLKWTFLVGAFATLGTACVVTSGDGGDDVFGDGGESGSSTTTAGKASTAGTGGAATAGTNTGGGGSATAGTGAGGEGGEVSTYVPGACEVDLATPSNPRDTTLNDDDNNDPNFACRKCLKVSCTDAWATCYGDTPTIACGYGSTEDAKGQFECIRSCFVADDSGDDVQTVLMGCEDQCLDQCAEKDEGFVTGETLDMLECGQDKCLAECFTP